MKLPTGMHSKVNKDGRTVYFARVRRHGRRYYRTLGTNKRAAEAKFARFLLELADDPDARPANTRVALTTLVAGYRDHVTAHTGKHHAKRSIQQIENIFEYLGATRVSDLSVSALEKWQHFRQGLGRANRTINIDIGYVMTMLRWAYRSSLIHTNPVEFIRKLPEGGRHQKVKRRRLTRDECQRLLIAAEEAGVGLMVDIALASGFRIGEILRLKWCDFGRNEEGAGTLTARDTKNREDRTNPIHERLAERLSGLRKTQGRKIRRLPRADDHIITTPRTHKRALEKLYRAAEHANVERKNAAGLRLDWHALRHTYCTELAARGVEALTIQALMGHKTIQVTLKYVELARTPKTKAIEVLGDPLGEVNVSTNWAVRGKETQ